MGRNVHQSRPGKGVAVLPLTARTTPCSGTRPDPATEPVRRGVVPGISQTQSLVTSQQVSSGKGSPPPSSSGGGVYDGGGSYGGGGGVQELGLGRGSFGRVVFSAEVGCTASRVRPVAGSSSGGSGAVSSEVSGAEDGLAVLSGETVTDGPRDGLSFGFAVSPLGRRRSVAVAVRTTIATATVMATPPRLTRRRAAVFGRAGAEFAGFGVLAELSRTTSSARTPGSTSGAGSAADGGAACVAGGSSEVLVPGSVPVPVLAAEAAVRGSGSGLGSPPPQSGAAGSSMAIASRRRASSQVPTVAASTPHARTKAVRSSSRGRSSRASTPETVARGSASPASLALRSSCR